MNALKTLRRLSRVLWIRAIAIGTLAIVAILLTPFLGPLVPSRLADLVSEDGVDRVLDSLASAMLTVTTFSVSVMVAIRNFATSRWTPRYLKLLSKDPITQNILATFIGAYIFSLTAIILSNTAAFTQGGYFLIFAMTIVTITLVIVAIVRWVDHLQEVGSLTATASHLQGYVLNYFEGKKSAPCWGARDSSEAPPADPTDSMPLVASKAGYIAFLDLKKIQRLAARLDGAVVFTCQPGDYVRRNDQIGHCTNGLDPSAILKGVLIKKHRTFEQDVRLGLIAIGDIAVKAVSPGINDPQTAVEVIKILDGIVPEMDMDERPSRGNLLFPNVWVAPSKTDGLMDAAFDAILRYGGSHRDVMDALVDTFSYFKDHGSVHISQASQRLLSRATQSAATQLELRSERDHLARTLQDVRSA